MVETNNYLPSIAKRKEIERMLDLDVKANKKLMRWLMKQKDEELAQEDRDRLLRGYCPECNRSLTYMGKCTWCDFIKPSDSEILNALLDDILQLDSGNTTVLQ